ncbi:hypothetical protein ES703_31433 [subsurface metagenome]
MSKAGKKGWLYGLFSGLSGGAAIIGITLFVIGICFDALNLVALGLAFISISLGLNARQLGEESKKQMKAVANRDVCDKIAMMYAYMGNQQERNDWGRKAALELKDWVKPELWKKFEEAQQKHREHIEQNR